METLALFSLATLIWGSTWIAITFQLGTVAPEVSIVYRFAIAAAMVAAWCRARRASLAFPLRQHAWFAAQGTLMFGLNYAAVYRAEQHIASGVVAVLFSLIVFFNLVGARLCFGTEIRPRMLLGAALGVAGVALLFWRELGAKHGDALAGVGFALGATVLACGGNMLAARNQRRGVPLLPGVFWGMSYGTLGIAAVALLGGMAWSFDPRPGYVWSLLYLAAFGSVLAFAAYLTLLGKIGVARAGYVGVAVPAVALLLSTFFERYEWTLAALAGVALCLVGNVLVLLPDSPLSRGGEGRG